MDTATLRRAGSAALMGIGGLLWLSAILFMAQTAQNSEQFGRLHPWILMVNVAGLVLLLVLLGFAPGVLLGPADAFLSNVLPSG